MTTLFNAVYFRVDQNDEDLDVRSYHSRLELISGWGTQSAIRGQMLVVGHDGKTENLCSTLNLVMNIPGVSWAQVHAYRLDVRKSPIFTWREIDSHLLELFHGIEVAITGNDAMFRKAVFDATHTNTQGEQA